VLKHPPFPLFRFSGAPADSLLAPVFRTRASTRCPFGSCVVRSGFFLRLDAVGALPLPAKKEITPLFFPFFSSAQDVVLFQGVGTFPRHEEERRRSFIFSLGGGVVEVSLLSR